MAKEINSVVVGMGEVGSALFEYILRFFDAFPIDIKTPIEIYPDKCRYLNICIPFSDRFVEDVNEYIERLQPELTINHSSVPVGTTKKLNGLVVHSPIRGKHPNMIGGIEHYIKFIGYNNESGKKMSEEYLGKIFNTFFVENTDHTEFLKIISLSKYLAYLAVADEINEICKSFGVDYKLVKEWDYTQNIEIQRFYHEMKIPVLNPPEGKIGGHCVMPITEMLVNDPRFSSKIISQIYSQYKNL
jgi:UDP-N-acetyl-D-mannosaminuronate dehydrogenase